MSQATLRIQREGSGRKFEGILREFEQLSYAEISDVLQLPLNTVRSRLFRARTALRNLLEPPVELSTKDAPLNTAQKGERE